MSSVTSSVADERFRVVSEFEPAGDQPKAIASLAEGVEAGFLHRVWNPIYAFEVLGISPPGAGLARGVYVTLLASIALGFFGLFTRTSTALAALLSEEAP